jgi:hypothetical protein
MKAWACESGEFDAPCKSSLTRARSRIHFQFFERQFRKLIDEFEPKRFELRGYRVYAVDGQDLRLTHSESILKEGYRGAALPCGKETYYPHLYVTHAYDVISGVTKALRFNKKRQEIVDAIDMVGEFETNSVCLYDRYYLSKKLVAAHHKAGNYFIARCKRSAFLTIDEFFAGVLTRSTTSIDGVAIQLLKVINPRTKEAIVLATNLPLGVFKKREVAVLYTRRWLVEGFFKDSTVSHLRLEDWHSKSINGILQELFAHYWLLNFSRIQVALQTSFNPAQWLASKYSKPNLKLVLEIIIDAIPDIAKGRLRKLLEKLQFVLRRTLETRFHLTREYPRQVKTPGERYPRAKTVERRAA